MGRRSGNALDDALGGLRRALPDRVRLMLSAEFAFREQFAYGHREILCRFANLPADAVLLGRVQHGWDPFETEPAGRFRPPLRVESSQWVWTNDAADRAYTRGVRRVHAIGAPWLYLLKGFGHPKSDSAGGLLAMPGHYNELSSVPRHAQFANSISELGWPGDVTVALHGLDFMTRGIRDVYACRGWLVESAGWPIIAGPPRQPSSTLGDRTRYLTNLLDFMTRSSTLITDAMGTHVLYAGTVGMTVLLWPGDPPSWEDHQPSGTAALLSSLRDERAWQEKHLGRFYRDEIPQQVLDDLIARFLGVDATRSPADLARVLEWQSNGG